MVIIAAVLIVALVWLAIWAIVREPKKKVVPPTDEAVDDMWGSFRSNALKCPKCGGPHGHMRCPVLEYEYRTGTFKKPTNW